jgi:hypothetical protein
MSFAPEETMLNRFVHAIALSAFALFVTSCVTAPEDAIGDEEAAAAAATEEVVESEQAVQAERCNPYYDQLCSNDNWCGGFETGQDNPGGICGFRPPFPQGPVGKARLGQYCNAYDGIYCQRGLLCDGGGQFETGRCVRPDEPLRNPERVRIRGEACNNFYSVVCAYPSFCGERGTLAQRPYLNGVCL